MNTDIHNRLYQVVTVACDQWGAEAVFDEPKEGFGPVKCYVQGSTDIELQMNMDDLYRICKVAKDNNVTANIRFYVRGQYPEAEFVFWENVPID